MHTSIVQPWIYTTYLVYWYSDNWNLSNFYYTLYRYGLVCRGVLTQFMTVIMRKPIVPDVCMYTCTATCTCTYTCTCTGLSTLCALLCEPYIHEVSCGPMYLSV